MHTCADVLDGRGKGMEKDKDNVSKSSLHRLAAMLLLERGRVSLQWERVAIENGLRKTTPSLVTPYGFSRDQVS